MIIDSVKASALIEKGDRVLCAVSGGADSMCLLHMLHANSGVLGITVVAAHYEHGIRGEESIRDRDFVKAWCEENKIEFITESGNAPKHARENSLSAEEAARELRYAFLERAADKLGCNKIATAHNLSDNSETVLFNLVRGAGARGLGGIPQQRGRFIRPLLSVSRTDIERYLADNNIPHVEDKTNSEDSYTRNKIRHGIMPQLREINPGADEAILRAAELIRRDDDYLTALAQSFADENIKDGVIPDTALLGLPYPVASRVIRIMTGPVSMQHVDEVIKLAEGTERRSLALPGIIVTAEGGRLFFRAEEQKVPEIEPFVVRPGEEYILPEQKIKLSTFFADCLEIHGLLNISCLNYDEIKGDLVCSSRRPGDEIRPAGRGCTKALRKLFMEKKLTQNEKAAQPVLRDDCGVVAVAGMCVDERVKVNNPENILCVRVEKLCL